MDKLTLDLIRAIDSHLAGISSALGIRDLDQLMLLRDGTANIVRNVSVSQAEPGIPPAPPGSPVRVPATGQYLDSRRLSMIGDRYGPSVESHVERTLGGNVFRDVPINEAIDDFVRAGESVGTQTEALASRVPKNSTIVIAAAALLVAGAAAYGIYSALSPSTKIALLPEVQRMAGSFGLDPQQFNSHAGLVNYDKGLLDSISLLKSQKPKIF